MKFVKWKILVLTTVVCVLPVFFGMAVWNDLPDKVAIHFDINNNPDNYTSKGFAVYGLPAMMVVLQWFCCFINDINAKKFGDRKKFEYATKWIIPLMSFVLYVITIGYALGWKIDIRIAVSYVVGLILLVIGNYLPKFDIVKGYKTDTEKARKINRFIGYEMVILGLLFIISTFLPPVAGIVCILLLIPYGISSTIYTIKIVKGTDE